MVILMLAVLDVLKAQDKSEGFVIEVVDPITTSQILQNLVTFDYIHSLHPDTIVVNDKKGNPVHWIGVPLLNVIEEKTGIDYSRIEKLVTDAPDGYNSVISFELLPELKAAYLVYGLADENNWLNKFGQFRIIFTNLREMYFVSNPEKIIVYIKSQEKISANQRFYFLGRGELSTFTVGSKQTQLTIKIEDILSALNLNHKNLTLLTSDGLEREYFYNDIIKQMELKIENEGTWKIVGKKVPIGLRTRKIFYLQSADVGIFLKSLADEEIVFWENYLQERFLKKTDFNFEVVSQGDERIPVKLSDEAGIYKSIINMLNQNPDAVYVELIYNH